MASDAQSWHDVDEGATRPSTVDSVVQIPDSIASRLTIARRELLDPSLRNPLLNYRSLKARGVEIVGENPSEVFQRLVRQGRELRFGAKAADSTDDAPDEVGPDASVRRVSFRLATDEDRERLQKLLLATYRVARTTIEEQGVNTLYIALGMLRWYDKDTPDQPRRAPLVLVPVELGRADVSAHFRVSYSGEEIGTNLSLAEKLKAEWGISLPAVPDADELDINSYFDSMHAAIESEPSWIVERDAIVLGFFSFAKLLMFKDLDPAAWPEDKPLLDHPVLNALLGDGFRHEPSSYTEDTLLDEVPDAIQLHTVMDADSSQAIAILDVLSGRNMVIQGPPGTGKSQTIANLIAEALAEDKKVLFVAEKLAALEVVKRRLDRAGLGDACLELHSRNTQKKILLEELRRTIELGAPHDKDSASERRRVAELRGTLNEYVDAVSAPVGRTRTSPHSALGHVVRLRQQWGEETRTQLEVLGLDDWDDDQYRRLVEKAGELQAALQQSGIPEAHPFFGSQLTRLTPTDEVELKRAFEKTIEVLSRLAAAGNTLAEMCERDMPNQWPEVDQLVPPGWQVWRSFWGKDRQAREEVKQARSEQLQTVKRLMDALRYDASLLARDGAAFVDRPFADQVAVLRSWVEAAPSLRALVAFNVAAAKSRSEAGTQLVELASSWSRAAQALVAAVQYTWFHALLARAYRERDSLAAFSRESHEHTLSEFQRLDAEIAALNSSLLARKHWDGLPHEQGGGQLAVLRREFEKKTRHLPIRQLMAKAGLAVQAIKPVFMMSPLSIANYLPPDSIQFDLVVFDEASQVRPVDAFGALARGRQATVVGDTRQLPPTSFFDSLTAGEDEADEDSVTSDLESVLSLFAAQMAPERMLRWHYRSRHESLIAVSNHAFYNDKLIVFPSPDAGRGDVGLRLRYLPDSVYERGSTRTNRIEARAVAEACMEHARINPELSLGVAAFSAAQMRAIEDELEILRRQDQSAEEFFNSRHPHERFFVKNLETVQGDERDVIFISIGYGRDVSGRLTRSFGPLNSDGGERRLNVLITRAKRRCEVFTSLRAEDIDDTNRGPGVRALKMFLGYAEDGKIYLPQIAGREADSPFEESVYYELTVLHGYDLRQQVGAAGYRIDLAVVDPEHPGRYLLGVECDGATYHSAKSARDRDRLRQQVLENLGWRIHRIWSTDWFRDREGEVRRIIAAVEAAKSAPAPKPPVVAAIAPAVPQRIERDLTGSRSPAEAALPAYRIATLRISTRGQELYQVDRATLAEWIAQVVQVESPVHRREVMRRIIDAVGVQRIGNRIDAAMMSGVRFATSKGTVVQLGDFLWSPGMTAPVIRTRAHLADTSRKLEFVAPEEIDETIRHVIRGAYAITPEDVPAEASRLLGFARVSEDMRSLINDRLISCMTAGTISTQGQYLCVR